jgi:hypothetical protein
MNTDVAAHIFTVLIMIVVAFQIALAAELPWGHLTWSGKFPGRLPVRMRGVAVFSAMLLLGFALIIETRAGVLLPQWQPVARVLSWVVVAYCALGVFANAVTPSRWERIVWLPVVLVCLFCSFLVALS